MRAVWLRSRPTFSASKMDVVVMELEYVVGTDGTDERRLPA